MAKTRYNQIAVRPTRSYVGSAGKYGVEYFGYLTRRSCTCPVGTPVTFQMTKGSFENHTATTAAPKRRPGEGGELRTRGQIAASFFDPAGFDCRRACGRATTRRRAGVADQDARTATGSGTRGVLDVPGTTRPTPDPDRRTVTFGEAGTYDFYCMVHPQMHGQVVVG